VPEFLVYFLELFLQKIILLGLVHTGADFLGNAFLDGEQFDILRQGLSGSLKTFTDRYNCKEILFAFCF